RKKLPDRAAGHDYSRLVIEFTLDAADVAQVRFARSPLDELVHSVNVLAGRRGAQLHGPWLAMTRPRVATLDLTMLDALVRGPKYFPDCLLPPPQQRDANIDDELERVRATDPDEVTRSIELCRRNGPLPAQVQPLLRHPRAALGQLVDLMRAYWQAA